MLKHGLGNPNPESSWRKAFIESRESIFKFLVHGNLDSAAFNDAHEVSSKGNLAR